MEKLFQERRSGFREATVLQTSCPSCDRALSLPETMLGQQVRCPICSHVFEAAERTPRPQSAQPAAYRTPAPADEDGPPARPRSYREYSDRDYDDDGPLVASPQRASAAVWMLIAGVADTLVLLVFYVFVFTVDHRPPPQEALIFITMFAAVLYFAPLVFVFIAAAIVRTAQGSGLVITGSVMAFIIAFEQLILGTSLGIGIMINLSTRWQHDRLPASIPILFVLSLLALVLSIIAGVKALIAISRGRPRRPSYY